MSFCSQGRKRVARACPPTFIPPIRSFLTLLPYEKVSGMWMLSTQLSPTRRDVSVPCTAAHALLLSPQGPAPRQPPRSAQAGSNGGNVTSE